MDLEQLAKDALNLARVYPEHAAQYRRAADNRDMANACRRYIRGTELGTELDSGDRDPQAQRDYDWQTERCGRDWQTLTYLRVAVAGLLPGLHLRLIPMGGKPWHEREEKEMDWPAACQELQQIVYAAVTANSRAKPGEAPTTEVEPQTATQSPAQAVSADEVGRLLDLIGEGTAIKILKVAKDQSLTVDQRMRALVLLDQRLDGRDSPKWAELLDVTEAAVRKADFWKERKTRKEWAG